jgi:hypothetical protein
MTPVVATGVDVAATGGVVACFGALLETATEALVGDASGGGLSILASWTLRAGVFVVRPNTNGVSELASCDAVTDVPPLPADVLLIICRRTLVHRRPR